MTTSRTPKSRSAARWYSISRWPPTSSSGFGSRSVSGRMRSPRPAARIMAFNANDLRDARRS